MRMFYVPILFMYLVFASTGMTGQDGIFHLIPNVEMTIDRAAWNARIDGDPYILDKPQKLSLSLIDKKVVSIHMVIQSSYARLREEITDEWRDEEEIPFRNEWIVMNGLRFLLTLHREENCGLQGNYVLYDGYAKLDTILNGLTLLKAYVYVGQTSDPDQIMTSLKNSLEVFNGFRLMEEKEINNAFPGNGYIEVQEVVADDLTRYEQKYFKLFRRHLAQLHRSERRSDTPFYDLGLADGAYVLRMCEKHKKRRLSHILSEKEYQLARAGMDNWLDQFVRYNYSEENRYRIEKRIAANNIPPGDYLNFTHGKYLQNELDTLHTYQSILHTHFKQPGQLQVYWRDPVAYLLELEDYEPSAFTEQFEASVTKHILHQAPGSVQLKEMTWDPDGERFMISTTGNNGASINMLNCWTCEQSGKWTYTLDTLPPNCILPNEIALTPWGNGFVLSMEDSVQVWDTTGSGITIRTFQRRIDIEKDYAAVANRTSILYKGKFIEALDWDAHLRMLSAEQVTSTSELKNAPTDIVRVSSPYLMQNMLSPDKMLFKVPYQKRDLDNDGSEEFFSCALSNGELKWVHCLTRKNGVVVEVDNATATGWLMNDMELHNVLVYSQIGRHPH